METTKSMNINNPSDNDKNIVFGTVKDQLLHESKEQISKGLLVLKDGEVIEGISFGFKKNICGEVVFNTGMVGYPESLTDPSYAGQILVLTYPLIGNYGIPSDTELDKFGLLKHFESNKIQITALIISDYSFISSHYRSFMSLSQWLTKHKIPALYNIDTRKLTKKLRVNGSMLGKIMFNKTRNDLNTNDLTTNFIDPNKLNLVEMVSRSKPQIYYDKTLLPDPNDCKKDNKTDNKYLTVIAIDCGIKNNIIRYLCSKGIYLKVVPWNYNFNNDKFDGLFISNGPGDPSMVKETINNVREFITNSNNDIPFFGICLGNQILALAAGAKTYKMKFGNRGMNQPVIDLRTSRCYITPQNHGFAVDEKTLPMDWKPFFRNANDHSNEGIIHAYKPYFSVQFHPEAQGGPTDTEFLFDMFLSRIKNRNYYEVTIANNNIIFDNITHTINKVLLLGSGGLSIGQAGEFDYSGSQAIKALKEENLNVILINPNVATVQTSWNMADDVYFLPVTVEYVIKVIEKERPQGILLQFGGQTALNVGIKLKNLGIFEKYNIKVLGTPIETIELTEDREAFAKCLKEINEAVAPSISAYNLNEAIKAAKKIGYPVLLRSAFALGGLGSGFASNEFELKALAIKAFSSSEQVIIDKSLRGWKEVEYEVVRDINDNCVTVCNMENFDPLGIHTGDSIVVAPSQTLSNNDYYMLRTAAIKIVRHLGVVGECNIQYALDPFSDNYCVIEVNARLSRSSALASKATGYPLAYVAAKLALNKTLPTIKNSITKATQSCFEPSLDYCVVKIPRWDMKKFNFISFKIGSAMKSVGEVMGIDRKFEAAFSKALRMVYQNLNHCDGFGFVPKDIANLNEEELNKELKNPSDIRIFAIASAFKRNYSVKDIYNLTKIDPWFLCKLRNIICIENNLMNNADNLTKDLLLTAKKNGCSDKQIGRAVNKKELEIRKLRLKYSIKPYVKQIDTLAAEYPAFSNYLYVTYNANEHDLDFNDKGIIILGCGAYRIGSSCEFDWCAVSAIRCLKNLNNEPIDLPHSQHNSPNTHYHKHHHHHHHHKHKKNLNKKKLYTSIVINYNPETISTDYDECDRMYFEELSFERVLDIYELERSRGVIVSVGGQISNNLAIPLFNSGVNILGTQPDRIDCAENRHRFSKLLDDLHVDQPAWCEARAYNEALSFAKKVAYPVLIRPSYVLSGAAMAICYDKSQLSQYLKIATDVSREHPVVISKFITNAKEIEIDAVAYHGTVLNYAISEHVEHAGVHSGDATLVLPAQNLYVETIKRIKKITNKIAQALDITGPFNIQFLSKDNDIKVIECNLRASRSFPFVSKTFNVNFIELATRCMVLSMNDKNGTNQTPLNTNMIKPVNFNLFDMDYVCVKSPMFSFTRLQGADPVLRVEMASTGEVACFGDNKYEAFLKAIVASGCKLPIPDPNLSTSPQLLRLDYIYADLNIETASNSVKDSRANSPALSQNEPPQQTGNVKDNENDKKVDENDDDFKLKLRENNSHLSVLTNNDNENDNDSDDDSISFNYEASPFGSPSLKKFNYHNLSQTELKYLSLTSTKYRCNILVSIGPQKAKYSFVECAQQLRQMGFNLYATENTHLFLKTHTIESTLVYKPSSDKQPNVIDLIGAGDIHLVLNVPGNFVRVGTSDGYKIRRKSVDFHVPLISNIKLAKMFVRSLAKKYLKSYDTHFDDEFLHIKSWKEYMQSAHRI